MNKLTLFTPTNLKPFPHSHCLYFKTISTMASISESEQNTKAVSIDESYNKGNIIASTTFEKDEVLSDERRNFWTNVYKIGFMVFWYNHIQKTSQKTLVEKPAKKRIEEANLAQLENMISNLTVDDDEEITQRKKPRTSIDSSSTNFHSVNSDEEKTDDMRVSDSQYKHDFINVRKNISSLQASIDRWTLTTLIIDEYIDEYIFGDAETMEEYIVGLVDIMLFYFIEHSKKNVQIIISDVDLCRKQKLEFIYYVTTKCNERLNLIQNQNMKNVDSASQLVPLNYSTDQILFGVIPIVIRETHETMDNE
jgi:hypothetical protein